MLHRNVRPVWALGMHLNHDPSSAVAHFRVFWRGIPLERNHFLGGVTQNLETLGPGPLVLGVELDLVGSADCQLDVRLLRKKLLGTL